MAKVTVKELESGKVTLNDLTFFPCVRTGITQDEQRGKESKYGYGRGLVKYLNENAKGKINSSYKEGDFGYLKFKSKRGNEIVVEIAGGCLNATGDYLHIINKTRKKDRYVVINEKCEDIDESDYNCALHICKGRLKWK